ncbi:hypothetical protein, variant, partial [Puccinia triticina 1-1 BBBD Race 1]
GGERYLSHVAAGPDHKLPQRDSWLVVVNRVKGRMSYYFVIVGVLDNPIYEAHLTTSKTSASSSVPPAPLSAHPSYSLLQELSGPLPTSVGGVVGDEKVEKEKEGPSQEDQSVISYARKDSERGRHVVQLVSHAALDTIDALIWSEKSMHLKQIDRFHEWSVSAWIPPGGTRFFLSQKLAAVFLMTLG